MTSEPSAVSRASSPPKPRGLRRALWILASIVVGLECLYLVAANLFLNLNLLPLAFAGTNQVRATIGGGWTVIPGRVHVQRVRVTFQDHNLQFAIELPRGFLVVHLSELLQHTFHGSHLRGEGLSFRMRHRVDPWSKDQPAVGAFAPIPEFLAPAVFEAYVPEAPISDAKYNLWTVHLDDVDVAVSEFWVQAFRYRGKGRASGKFELKPARRLWVGPAALELDPGVLSAGGYRVASGLHGRIDCTVHPFDVRVPQGMEVFRDISARIRLDSAELDPQVYALFASDPAPQVSSANGSLHLDVQTNHGVMSQESRLELSQRGFQLRTPELELDADRLFVRAEMQGESDSAVTLTLDHGTVREPIALGYPPRIEHLSATLVSDNRDVARDFNFREARLGEARLLLADSRWFNRWLKGKGFELSGGGISVLARGRYAGGTADGEAVLESNGLDAKLGVRRVRYAGTVTVQAKDVNPKELTGSLLAELTGRSLKADAGASADKGELDLADLHARVFARRDARGSTAHGEAKLRDFTSTIPGLRLRAPELNAVLDSEQTRDGTQITHFDATIPALVAEGPSLRLTSAALARGTLAQPKNRPEQRIDLVATLLKPEARFGARPQKVAVTPRVDVHAALTRNAAGAFTGKVSLLPAAWQVDAANMRFSGRSALTLDLSELDLARHSGALAARLSGAGITVGDTTQNADCAWSRVQALELDGTAKLLARDTTSVSLKGEFGQTELSWGDFTTRADIGLAARFEQGFARDSQGTVDLSFQHAAIQSGGGGKNGWSATAPTVDIAALVSEKDGKISGSAKVNTEHVQGRIGATHLTSDLRADFNVDALDLVGRTAHASGDVHVRNAALPNAAEPVSNWWADVRLDSLYGHAQQNLELGGTFRAQLRDATPGLAVLASQGSLPQWVASAFPLRGLSVTGSLARRCRLTDIHLVNLSGGPALARGRLQSLPDGFQGALLLRLSGFQAISAGLDFDSNHTHFGLFDGDAWLARFDQHFDRKSEDATRLVCPPDTNQCSAESDSSQSSSTGARSSEQASSPR